MYNSDISSKLYFRSGSIILISSWYLLFRGYRALWSLYFEQNSHAFAIALAFVSVMIIFVLARYFEKMITESLRSRIWLKFAITGTIGAILLALSALGVANALYYTVAGRHVIESGVKKLLDSYTLLASETEAMTATPVYDAMVKRMDAPLAALDAEIKSVSCGIGSGADAALREVEKILGSSFRRLNISPNRMPRCDNRSAVEQLARDYRDHIQKQMLGAPDIMAENSLKKIEFRTFMEKKYELFRKQASDVIEAASDAEREVNLFGSRDGFNEPVRQLIGLNERFLNDRALAIQKAAALGGSYSPSVRRSIDLEQEKSLGSFQSLYLALANFNPWYVVLFILFALIIDVVLVIWIHYTRTRVFAEESTAMIGQTRDRVRYLWTPPTVEQREQP